MAKILYFNSFGKTLQLCYNIITARVAYGHICDKNNCFPSDNLEIDYNEAKNTRLRTYLPML